LGIRFFSETPRKYEANDTSERPQSSELPEIESDVYAGIGVLIFTSMVDDYEVPFARNHASTCECSIITTYPSNESDREHYRRYQRGRRKQ